MTIHTSDDYFEELKSLYLKFEPVKVRNSLRHLISFMKSSDILSGKLRYHPLGFLYPKLHEFPSKETIRIHIWSNDSNLQKPLMDIHNHFYDVHSFIWQGAVMNNLYSFSIDEAPTHCIYKGSYLSGDRRILSKSNEKYLVIENERQIVEGGKLYSISKNQVHSGGNAFTGMTITIVYTAKPGHAEPLVFGPLDGNERYEYSSNLVESDIINELKKNIND